MREFDLAIHRDHEVEERHPQFLSLLFYELFNEQCGVVANYYSRCAFDKIDSQKAAKAYKPNRESFTGKEKTKFNAEQKTEIEISTSNSKRVIPIKEPRFKVIKLSPTPADKTMFDNHECKQMMILLAHKHHSSLRLTYPSCGVFIKTNNLSKNEDRA